MNNQQLQTKRQTKKGFRRLQAKATSVRRKQRASASANPEMFSSDVPNPSISRSLTVILLLHVVAIGAVYIGVQWNRDRKVDSAESKAPVATLDLENLNAGLRTDFVVAGDSYATFAARHKVDEAELRKVNGNSIIHAGKALYLPAQQIKPESESVAVSDRPALPASNTVVQVNAGNAQLVKPAIGRAVVVAPASSLLYKVKSGDSVWRICNQHKVSQDALMKLNNLKNARELKAGMTLKIPAQ